MTVPDLLELVEALDADDTNTAAPPGWPSSREIARANLLVAVDRLREEIAGMGNGASEALEVWTEFERVCRETKIFLWDEGAQDGGL